jgi:hypothetical protein
VVLHYRRAEVEAEIHLGEEWKIHPTGAVIESLTRLAGHGNVHLVYR